MFKRVQIKGGYGFVNGEAANIKIISAASQVRVVGLSVNDKPIFESIMRAPWGMQFEQTVKRVEFHSDTDQTIEVWLGKMPLDYVQMVAVGGTSIKTTEVGLTAGSLQQVLQPALRKKVLVKTTTPVRIKSDPLDAGWPLAENGEIELELTGALYAQKAASTFISAAAEHALISPENFFVDANTRVVFYRKMKNGDLIVQRYTRTLTVYLAGGGVISGDGLACDDPQTGAVYCLFAPRDNPNAPPDYARIYRHNGAELEFLLKTTTALEVNSDCLSLGADNALYMGGWLSGYKVIRFDLVTGNISSFASASYVGAVTCAIDGYIYYVTNSTLIKRKGMSGNDESVLSGMPNAAGVQSRGYQNVFFLRASGATTKTSKIVNLLTLDVQNVTEPSAIGDSRRYATYYNGVDWFMGKGDGQLLRVQNGTIEVVGGAVNFAGGEECAFVGYDEAQEKIVVGVSPADSEIKAASIDVITLGDSRPAVVSMLETFV